MKRKFLSTLEVLRQIALGDIEPNRRSAPVLGRSTVHSLEKLALHEQIQWLNIIPEHRIQTLLEQRRTFAIANTRTMLSSALDGGIEQLMLAAIPVRKVAVMKRSRFLNFPPVLAVASMCLAMAAGAQTDTNAHRLWKPVADEVYLQEVGVKIATDQPVTSVAIYDNMLHAVVGGSVNTLRDGVLQDSAGAPKNVRRLRSLDGALWAATDDGAYRFAGSTWERVDARPFTDFCVHLRQVYGATRDDLYRFENGGFVNIKAANGYLSSDSTLVMEDFSQVLADPVQIGPVERIAFYSGTLYLLGSSGISLLDGKTFVPDPIDWGALPSPVTRDMLAQGSRIYAATDRGLAVLRGMAMTTLRGPDGLPYEDTTCLAAGFDDDLWIGTTRDAIRKVGDEFHYFGAHHWLPDENVRDIAVGEHVVCLATDAGLGVIRYEPYTLLKKATYFERELDEWGFKRLGFVHKLYWAGATPKAGSARSVTTTAGIRPIT